MSEAKRFDSPPPMGVALEQGVYVAGLDESFRRNLNFRRDLFSYTKLKRHDNPDDKISKYVAGVGNLVNDYLLFGEDALPHYLFWPNQYDARTPDGKREQAEAQAAAKSAGQVLIRPKQKDEALQLIDQALGNPDIVEALEAPGYCEAGVVADVDGLMFRSWLDKLTQRAAIDIKTSRCANEEEFLEQISRYGYDGQAALYLDSCEALGLGQLDFYWLVICKTNPRSFLVKCPTWAYWTGRRWRQSVIRSYFREQQLKGDS